MTISVLGCGWLGIPLAEHLRDRDYIIKGSTTSPSKLELLKGKQIRPYLLKLDPCPRRKQDDFWQSDLLIVTIPPKVRVASDTEYFMRQVHCIAERATASPISFLLFASSTSVYPENCGIVDEADAVPEKAGSISGNALLKAEEQLLSAPGFDTTVLRFGGLYGGSRHPARYLAGREALPKGPAPINLIHRDDCVGICDTIIRQKAYGKIFNGVSDGHPPRNMYYPAAAKKMGLEPPVYKEEKKKNYKVVSNRKVKQVLKYSFKYPNPMDF